MSVVSYDQYHWCPITLTEILGATRASIEYRSEKDGAAIKTRIPAGI